MRRTYFKQIFISIVALFCCATGKAYNYETFAVDGIHYCVTSEADLKVEVTYEGDNIYTTSKNYTGNIVIPEKVKHDGKTYNVTRIGKHAFCECTGVTNVVIPGSVTSIEDGAFAGCTGLTGIIIPENVATIGTSAFYGCTGLKEIAIPNGVTKIKSSAFKNLLLAPFV